MGKMKIVSQSGELTIFADLLSIGQRQPKQVIGDQLKELLDKNKMSSEDLVKKIGNSYRDTVTRVLNNQEIPKRQFVDKIINLFNLLIIHSSINFNEINNLIMTDNKIVLGQYATNDRTLEVKKQLDVIIDECYRAGKPISINMPKE